MTRRSDDYSCGMKRRRASCIRAPLSPLPIVDYVLAFISHHLILARSGLPICGHLARMGNLFTSLHISSHPFTPRRLSSLGNFSFHRGQHFHACLSSTLFAMRVLRYTDSHKSSPPWPVLPISVPPPSSASAHRHGLLPSLHLSRHSCTRRIRRRIRLLHASLWRGCSTRAVGQRVCFLR